MRIPNMGRVQGRSIKVVLIKDADSDLRESLVLMPGSYMHKYSNSDDIAPYIHSSQVGELSQLGHDQFGIISSTIVDTAADTPRQINCLHIQPTFDLHL